MQQRLVQVWYGQRAAPWPLRVLSRLYAAAVHWRRRAYARGWLRARRAGKPVIIVGNLTVGGTGKTPLVAWLARQLSATGLKVGIVSRGYGRRTRAVRAVQAATSWREVGDEPLLLQQLTGCDTVVARDRVAGSRELVSRGADVIIADDGLQHLRLARDCEIVVIDGTRGFGNGRLLPAGPLREEPRRALAADVIVVNGPNGPGPVPPEVNTLHAGGLRMSLHGDEAHRLDESGRKQRLEDFRGGRVHAVAGIGNPARFFAGLRTRGLDLIEHTFPDHHPFSADDLFFDDMLPVIMTEKDAVRCRGLVHERLWYVPVAARFEDHDARELLDRVLQKLGPATMSGD